MKRHLIMLIFFSFCFQSLIAQTGPGGVGNSTTNAVWLKADNITGLTNGDPLTGNWPDASGNNRHASQSTATYRPTYQSTGGIASLRFDGVNDYLDNTYTYTSRTVFVVYNVSSTTMLTSDLGQVWGNYADGVHIALDARSGTPQGFSFDGFTTSGTTAKYALDGDAFSAFVSNPLTPQYTYNQRQLFSGEFATTKTLNRQVIGSLFPSFTVGEHQFGGDIFEIIVYNTVLNTAQRTIIDNYLAAKYNINLATNDFYAYQATHSHDLAGVGRVDASNTHTEATSATTLKITSGAGLNADGEFLLYAHNGANGSTWTSTEVPSTNYERIAREWRFDETGELGTVTFTIDTALLNARPAGFSKFMLLVDADGDFSTGASVYTLNHASGSRYTVDLNIADGAYITIATFKPTIQFQLTASGSIEDVNNDSIIISISEVMGANATVAYAITGGAATAGGTDFTLAAGTATILAGDSAVAIYFTVNDDINIETTENFVITLSNPTGAILGSNTTHTYTIYDNDAAHTIGLTTTSGSSSEAVASVVVQIELDLVDNSNDISVDYAVIGGTASGSGVDYTLAAGTATIVAGQLTTSFTITLQEDALDELNETIIVKLTNPVNANLSANQTYTHTILDNDAAPQVSFNQTSLGIAESAGAVNLQVNLSAASGLNVTVNFTFGGTATYGTDYSVTSGAIVIPAGSTTANLTLNITDDTSEEIAETIVTTIFSVINATRVSPFVHTTTVGASDLLGTGGPAGVGDNTSNPLWLKADAITGVANNAVLTTWPDASGNGNNASQSNAAYRPIYKSSGVNGKPCVTFDGSNDFLDDARAYAARTVFIVFNANSATQATSHLAQLWGNYAEGVQVSIDPRTNPNGYSFDGNGSATARHAINNNTLGSAIANGNSAPWSFNTWNVLTVEFTATQNITRQIIGSLVPHFAVGVHQFGGDIAEIIVYSDTLGTTRRGLVQNYLAAKYNITIANDLYSYQSTHGNDLIGIGSADGVQNHFNSSLSGGVMSVSSPSALASGEYLLLGHNGGDIASFNAITSPNLPGVSKIGREWRVDEIGEVGTVEIAINATALPALPVGQGHFVLLVYNNPVFANGITAHRLVWNGSAYAVSGINLTDGDYISVAVASNISLGSGSFNTGANWASGSVPTTGTPAIVAAGHSLTLGSNTTAGSLLVSIGSTLSLGSYNLTLNAGDMFNSGTLNAGTGTVQFSASINQRVTTNGATLYNVTMSGSGGTTLRDDLDVSNVLTLTSGVVTTGSNRLYLTSNAASALVGGSSSSFVYGNLRRAIASNFSTYHFPVGNGIGSNNYYHAELVNNQLVDVDYIDASFVPLFNHNDNDLFMEENGYTALSMNTAGVWRLDPNQQPTSGSYDFIGSITNFSGLVDNDFVILKRPTSSVSGADWSLGGGSFNANSGQGRLVSHGEAVLLGLTSFSEFGASQGDGGGGFGLPIELLYLSAAMNEDNTVALSWATAIEIDNDFFTVERAADGVNFEELLSVAGAGNSINTLYYHALDKNPLDGVHYYRLKQTDFDGSYQYSDIVTVNNVKETAIDFTMYPNPANSDGFTIDMGTSFSINDETMGTASIVNMLGEAVAQQPISPYGTSKVALPAGLAQGMYLLQLNINQTSTTKLFLYE